MAAQVTEINLIEGPKWWDDEDKMIFVFGIGIIEFVLFNQ